MNAIAKQTIRGRPIPDSRVGVHRPPQAMGPLRVEGVPEARKRPNHRRQTAESVWRPREILLARSWQSKPGRQPAPDLPTISSGVGCRPESDMPGGTVE